MAVGIREMIGYRGGRRLGRQFVKYFVDRLVESGVPVVTPPGGLACHVDAHKFLPASDVASSIRPARWRRRSISPPASAPWSAARSRWTATRTATKSPPTSNWCASPFRAASTRCRTSSTPSTGSSGCYEHRDLVKGLKFTEEPPVLRFFVGRMRALDNWGAKLVEAFRAEFGPDC